MLRTKISRIPGAAIAVASIVVILAIGAPAAEKLKVLHSFAGAKYGGNSEAPLVFDTAGNIYGTTYEGGFPNSDCPFGWCGVVFELTPTSTGWKEVLLKEFSGGGDGANPYAGVVLGQKGNVYGTTYYGGGTGCLRACGVVFELSPASNGKWQEKVLHTFTAGADGAWPVAGLIFDSQGNLYGAASAGGVGGMYGFGVVFELIPTSDGKWNEKVLYTFTGAADGGYPESDLVFDNQGNLYGTTAGGGNLKCQPSGCGVVFKLTHSSDGRWTEAVLHTFGGPTDGAIPIRNLIRDKTGNLYGATYQGGQYNWGVAFKLTPAVHGKWRETVLHTFTGGKDGGVPTGLALDESTSTLYGTANASSGTGCGGYGCGVVFKLTPTSNGKWKEAVLYTFTGGMDGGLPVGRSILHGSGKIYGTTYLGGAHNWGTVFTLMP